MFTVVGRVSRRTFWLYYLAGVLAAGPLVLLTMVLYKAGSLLAPFALFFTIGVILLWWLGTIAVGIKRLHDLGKPGAMYLFSFVPGTGLIWLLISPGTVVSDLIFAAKLAGVGLLWVFIYLGCFPGIQHRNRHGGIPT